MNTELTKIMEDTLMARSIEPEAAAAYRTGFEDGVQAVGKMWMEKQKMDLLHRCRIDGLAEAAK